MNAGAVVALWLVSTQVLSKCYCVELGGWWGLINVNGLCWGRQVR